MELKAKKKVIEINNKEDKFDPSNLSLGDPNGNPYVWASKEEAVIFAIEFQRQNQDEVWFCEIQEAFSMFHGGWIYLIKPIAKHPSEEIAIFPIEHSQVIVAKAKADKEARDKMFDPNKPVS